MRVVVPVEEDVPERAAILEESEALRELGTVLQGTSPP
jgi:hypothetical protein